jgi:zinc transporter ZupT
MDWSQFGLVLAYATMTALATGLGALPLYFKEKAQDWLGTGQVIAAALMAMASVQLLWATQDFPIWMSAGGVVAGILFILLADKFMGRFPALEDLIQSHDWRAARQSFLIIFVMTVHSAAEGVGVGVSFGGGEDLGALISITIALHNIPEGLAIALIAVPNGMSVPKAALWSIISSLPQPLIGIFAWMFSTAFAPLLPIGMGFAAGAMGWMVVRELLPEARQSLTPAPMAGIFLATCVLFGTVVAVL